MKIKVFLISIFLITASLALPLIAGYAYHKGNWKNREPKELQKLYSKKVSVT